jgi:hypothetical protein
LPADASGAVTDTYEFPTSNLRIGLTGNTELGIVWQPYGIASPRGGNLPSARGIGNVTLRAKVNLWGNDGPARAGATALAVLPYIDIPTDGGNGIGESQIGFGLIVLFAIDLGGGLGLGINGGANFTRLDDGATYNAGGLLSASLAYEWTSVLGTYAEVVWEFSRSDRAGDIVTLDTGFTFALGRDWQLDAGVNIGATPAADPIAPFIGMTARF